MSIQVAPITGALGAEVSGVDLSCDTWKPDLLPLIRRALNQFCVLFFPEQDLDPVSHKAIGRRLGELYTHELIAGLPDHPEIIEVRKTETQRSNFGGSWHSDLSFLKSPPSYSILYALSVPDYGGDTLFANTYLAYEKLSTQMQTTINELSAVHSTGPLFDQRGDAIGNYRMLSIPQEAEALGEPGALAAVHPVAPFHPDTGRRCLFINETFTRRFSGMTMEESKGLLKFLCSQIVIPENTCRFRWRRRSVAIWDNRCTQHFALNDYQGKSRLMHRVTVRSENARAP